ncbi:MAG: exo-alpha-sialidase [Bacteroidaceae bacterium]|nr:exo-alpha-sialidase [Bacteroidaceae bacterium]
MKKRLLSFLLCLLGLVSVSAQVPKDGEIYYLYNDNDTRLYLYNDGGTLRANATERREDDRAYLWRVVANGDYFQLQNLQSGKYMGDKGYASGAYDYTISTADGSDDGSVTLLARATSKYSAIKKDGTINCGLNIYDKNTSDWSSSFVFEYWEGSASYTEDWAPGVQWYTLQIGTSGLHISYQPDAAYISLTTGRTELDDADLWTREGNDTDGYRLYNKAAGPNKVLAAPTTMSGTNGGSSYPVLKDRSSLADDETDLWLFKESTNITFADASQKGYYMYERGNEANAVNNRDGKLAFWTTGKDSGSTLWFTWAQVTLPVTMDNGSFTATNTAGTWASTWESTTEPPFTLSAGYNNMSVANSKGGLLQCYRGSYEPQPYTLSAGGKLTITGYSFDMKMSATTAITLTDALGKVYTSTADVQHVEVGGLSEPTATFTLSGNNNGVDLTNFLVTIQRKLAAPEPQFEVFTTASTTAIPYRIPAIATAYDGTLVAVADYRYSRVDIGAGRIDLHIRRSTDNGNTWLAIQKPAVMTGDGNTAVGHQEAGFGDPCIVGDIDSPRMLLTSCSGTPNFFAGNRNHHQGWARWYSEDNGQTWSAPTYLDEEFIYSRFDKSQYGPVTGWFVGSGRICQSRTVKVGPYRRLYCVGSTYNGKETANWALYSDDFGETWEFLGGCDVSPVPGGDEPKAEELPDGSVLLSSRTTGGRNFNIFTFTNTAKAEGKWSAVAFSGASNNGVTAVNNACNGEVMVVPVVRNADQRDMFLLLQSVPFGSGRANVGIYYKELTSLADFASPAAVARDWTGRHQSSYLGSAYSTMTWQQDNKLGFIYEEETHCGVGGGGYTIVYKNYSIEQLTDSAYSYKADVNADSLTAEGIQCRMEGVKTDNIVGQYTPEAVEIIRQACENFAAQPSRANYEQFNAILAEAPRVEIESGRYYRLRNVGRGNQNYYMESTDATLSVSTATQHDGQLFAFTAEGDGLWTLKSKASDLYVGPTQATETRTTMVSYDQAGTFSVASNSDGASSLRCHNPVNATYPFLHLAGDCVRIVPWKANSVSENAPSFWFIEPTDEVITAIEQTSPTLSPEIIYDLQGRRAQHPKAGIYIRNGKKVMK